MITLKMYENRSSILTEKQYKVLQLVAEGLTNAEIGEKLSISKRTAEGIRAELMVITKTKNTAALISHCFRCGILV
ncbi:response regulator transcription factor [Pedobacter agri]|uniref:response regulator transcription factor n=1 Tax=Pedobacter agri TaxID=454586 RepID=UPI0037428CFE